MDSLGVNERELARESRLSMATIRKAKDGRPLNKRAVGWLLDALSRKYGRTIEREEVEGLLVADEPQA
jgi:hypothetical protein